MMTFDDLPSELVHEIANYLAPTCCEDSKHDILSFRSVDSRNWIVGNQHACRFMTMNILSTSGKTKLGAFGSIARPDRSGCDVRNLTQHVRVMARPQIMRVTRADTDKSYYREVAEDVFLRMLGKNQEEMNKQEKTACKHYWTTCIEPYIRGFLPHSYINPMIKKELKQFPRLNTVYVDMEHEIPNTKTAAWRALEEVGVADKIWNRQEKHLRSLYHTWLGVDIDYFTDFRLILPLLDAIPPSVNKLMWSDRYVALPEAGSMDSAVMAQITEFDALMYPRGAFYATDHINTISCFSNLATLRLFSGKSTLASQYYKIDDDYASVRLSFLQRMVDHLTLPRLKFVHVKGYPVGLRELAALLRFAARHNAKLCLEDMMLVRALPLSMQKNGPQEHQTRANCWFQLSEVIQSHLPAYMSGNHLSFEGKFTYVGAPENIKSGCVWEHTLQGSLLKMYQDFLHTQNGAEELREELGSIASGGKWVDEDVRFADQHDQWE
jgi:hypothetical protein